MPHACQGAKSQHTGACRQSALTDAAKQEKSPTLWLGPGAGYFRTRDIEVPDSMSSVDPASAVGSEFF
jgi:hypothetical protein